MSIPTPSMPASCVYPMASSLAMQSIYAATFSLIGKPFFEKLGCELAHWTRAESVLIQELIPGGEYLAMGKTNECAFVMNKPCSCESVDCRHVEHEQFLLPRAVYPMAEGQAPEGTPVPLSTPCNTSCAKTLLDTTFCTRRMSGDGHTCSTAGCHRSFVGVRLDSEQGEPIGILSAKGVDADEMDTALAILQGVQQRVSRELEKMRDERHLIRAKNAAMLDAENKIKFLADMSHEIRTPMNAVIALTDLLLQERASLNAEQTEHLEVIQTSGHHLLTVINDILDISKMNHDPKFKLEHRRFSLRKCLKDALNMARHQASMMQQGKVVSVVECPADVDDRIPLLQLLIELETSGVFSKSLTHHRGKTVLGLIWKIDDDVPDMLLGDTVRLTQIIVNLCSNAVKFTKKGGVKVSIKRYVPTPAQSTESLSSRSIFKQRYDAKIENMWTTARNAERRNEMSDDMSDGTPIPGEQVILEISVTDTGIGIPADRLPSLFKSFSQLDISTARRYGGTGLGLAISSALANHMGGGLWAESEEGKGSRFALTLPMTVASPQRPLFSLRTESASTINSITSPSSPSSTLSDSSGTRFGEGFPLTTTVSPSSEEQPNSHSIHNSHPGGGPFRIINYPSQPRLPSPTVPMEQAQTTLPDQLPSHVYTKNAEAKRPSPHPYAYTSSDNAKDADVSPAQLSRVSRLGIMKHPHHRKPPADDENLAAMYPIRILLAEDNVLNQKIALSILKRLGYHEVAVANNGLEVLSLMRKQKFDVIFMDLYMPEMDGLETTRNIVAERNRIANHQESLYDDPLLNAADVYIIALTASASRQDRQVCIDAGMNDFMSKPFTMMEMKTSLKSCVNKRKKRRMHSDSDITVKDTFSTDMSITSQTHFPSSYSTQCSIPATSHIE